jgi:hypothetical protein
MEEDDKKMLVDIHRALVGDSELGVKGIVGRVDSLEEYREADKKMKWIGAGMITTVSSGLTAAATWFFD